MHDSYLATKADSTKADVVTELWSRMQVAEYLSVTDNTLRAIERRDADFPKAKVLGNKLLRYDAAAVRRWVMSKGAAT